MKQSTPLLETLHYAATSCVLVSVWMLGSAHAPQSPLLALTLIGRPTSLLCCSTLMASFVASTSVSKNILVASALVVLPSGISSCSSTDFLLCEAGDSAVD